MIGVPDHTPWACTVRYSAEQEYHATIPDDTLYRPSLELPFRR
jgi:hypothetical protein